MQLEIHDHHHPYFWMPQCWEYRRWWREGFGDPDIITFISEYGFGGITNLPEVVDEYKRRDVTEQAEDYQEYRAFLASLNRLLVEGNIRGLFNDAGDACRQAQEIHAQADCQMTEYLRCNPRALREGYLEALGAYLEEVSRGCSRQSVDYALLRTSDPLDAALAAYLSRRLGTHTRNR